MLKTCTKCGVPKEESSFNFKRREDNTRSAICKACHAKYRKQHYIANKKYYQRKARKWGRENPDRLFAQNLKKFGITPADYRTMLTLQKDVCAICKQPDNSKRLAVDHCHSTSKVRGLLCSACNMAIGLLCEDLDRMQAAITYIQFHNRVVA